MYSVTNREGEKVMIEIRNLVKNYIAYEQTIPILKGIDCTINDGEFVAILGPSGCGKSTLLNILGGLMQADSGEIVTNHVSTREYIDADWDDWRKKQIGIVFQSFHLVPHLTALQNVELAMSVSAHSKKERRKRAEALLCKVGLENRMKNKPSELSGGQKQRVAIARALANNPNMILADEPTGALDSATTKEIMELLKALNKEDGVTIIMVTHDEKIASQADRNIHLLDGRVVKDYYLERTASDSKGINKRAEKLQEYNEHCKMKGADIIAIAMRNLMLKKKRAFLTLLGIAVGIYSVVTMIGITNGVSDKVIYELETLSSATTVRVLNQGHSTDEIIELISNMEKLKEVESVEEVYTMQAVFAYEDSVTNQTVFSYDSKRKNEKLLLGEYPKSNDEITISKKAAEALVGKNNEEQLLGKEITVYMAYQQEESIAYPVEIKCTVSGITSSGFLNTGSNYISLTNAKEYAEASMQQKVDAQKTSVYLKQKEDRNSVINEIKAEGFEVASAEKTIKQINDWIKAIKSFFLLITSISLVVATFMVIIVQYMSVAERTKEIGIMRAIGASKADVRNIFLAEAGIIGLLSGLLGIGIAQFLGDGVNQVALELMKKNAFAIYSIKDSVVLMCIAGCMIICILAGCMPARKAASVDTIEVLR